MTLAVVAGLLGGCVGEPAPVETTPAFASEDEAFAAAEETYRAYVDALNARMSGSPGNIEPEDWLVGSALNSELESQEELAAAGKSNVGQLSVSAVEAASWKASSATVHVCLDVSKTQVLDADGTDVTPAARPLVVPLEVIVMTAGSRLLIADINGYPEGFDC
ncbi:hypothetical protein ACLQ2Q_04190 [Microbacterium sp. DT81.1]|uniref:hypothetical protein n=1 Tax=Microbacterium sp. DT81.1 TaxID=3393413 RepID=UPI003CF118AD